MSVEALPLAGIRVVEFSHMIMGPSCGLILGDLGADVVKIEPVLKGDNTRRLPGSGAGFFPTFNRNKRSLAIDIKSSRGLAFVKKLISRADVVTENFRSGALTPLGLDYNSLKDAHPRLVYCSLKGFLKGPYEGRAALDEVVQMMGGLAYMTGPVGRPLRAGASVNDMMGGMFAVIAIMAALMGRAHTGKGQFVRSGLFENNAWLVAPHMAQKAVTGQTPNPMPARISSWAVYDVFDTADQQQIFVGVVSDTQWRAFCEAFHQPQLLDEQSLATNAQRVASRELFIPKLRTVFGAMTRAEAAQTCEAAGLPFAPIKRPDELFDDPHLAEPGAMVPVTLESGSTLPIPALPIEMSGKRFGRRLDIPAIGEHCVQIAHELGYPDSEIDELFAEGVLSAPFAAEARPLSGTGSGTEAPVSA
ncbi:crotonobetainyl-CoA:carnitine CoA-transferase CaiB-like acyl-CoA transferase [Bradyrhizobium sp. S3.12.5]|uniref:CaiB/BaiF CoA transferase family protein n=1 Tax=Bradyrhizobium sp. S3.12.5 TaxID=3156386 RepID=UPI003398AA88